MDLIRQCEAQFLFPAAAPGSSDVFRLFRPIGLHHAPPGPSRVLNGVNANTMKVDIAPTSSTQSMPASQNVSEHEREDVSCSMRAGTGGMEAASEPTIQPVLGAMQPATPAEVLTGISCFFGAGGEVRIFMV